MTQYIAKRIALFIPTLVLVSLLIFAITNVIPGDPAVLIAGGEDALAVRQEKIQAVRRALGTDQPLYIQYGQWMWGVVRGRLGTSFWYGTRVSEDLKSRLPVSLQLAAMGFLVANLIALPLGCVSAVKQDSVLDYSVRVLTITGASVPYFFVALLIVYSLVWIFLWMPPLGNVSIWEDPGRNLQQFIFPAIALGVAETAFLARVTRSAMLEVLREDYVRTARAKGLGQRRVVWRHAMKNAFLPVITVSAWSAARVIGGTVITERVFLVPGMGALLLDSIYHRDLPVIRAVVLLVALVVMIINLMVDLVYAYLDPRIRYA